MRICEVKEHIGCKNISTDIFEKDILNNIKFNDIKFLKYIMRLRNPTIEKQKLYAIDDQNIKDSKIEEIIDSNSDIMKLKIKKKVLEKED